MKKQHLTQQLVEYIQAGYTAFYLKTAELSRADDLVAKVAESLNFKVLEYNLGYGKVNFDNKHVLDENQNSFEKILNSLRHEELEKCLIFIKDAKLGLENNPVALARLEYLLDTLNQYKGESALILQSADVYLPNEIEPLINLIELPLPNQTQIQAVLNEKNIANELTDRLSTALSGLNELDIERLLSLLKNKYSELKTENEKAILAEIQQQKEQIIAKSGVLEMVKVNEAIEDIGGLEKLKAWLQDQSYIVKNLQAAKEFGVKAPKGTLIAGMPGCGKSLTAKAAAALFQQPLLRLDIGSLLGKYVGESETNMRKALAMAESISPCVLWVDELEKAFVGMTGNNASEVSSRLFGYFLTWLQEKTAPVFIIATANDITALPPELLRKGRFDEIFYVGFPTKKERKKIIEIHLTKAKQQASEFDIDALASECRDYAGADIENAIFDAVKKAFISNNKILTQDLLLEAIRKTTPLRKTLKEKVGEYEKKFDELYLSPSSENDGLSIVQMNKMANDPNYLIRLKVAEDENVTEEILEQLTKNDNLEVRKAVFKNINCPTKVLDEQLSLDKDHKLYDEELLDVIYQNKNVSFELALSQWSRNDSKRARIDSLFKHHNLDLLEVQKSIVEYGGDYPQFLLAKNSIIHKEIRSKLFQNKLAKEAFCYRDDLTLIEGKNLIDNGFYIKMIENNSCGKNIYSLILDKLLYKYNYFDCSPHYSLSDEKKRDLNNLVNFCSKKYVTKSMQVKILSKFNKSFYKEEYIKELVFKFVYIYESTQEIILDMTSNSEILTKLIKRNELTHASIENIMKKKKDIECVKYIVRNKKLTLEEMKYLPTQYGDDVLKILANRDDLPEEIQLDIAHRHAWDAHLILVKKANLSEEVQKFLAGFSRYEAVEELAIKSTLSEEVQEKLSANDHNWKARQLLAKRGDLSYSAAQRLSKDNDYDVRCALRDNQLIPKWYKE